MQAAPLGKQIRPEHRRQSLEATAKRDFILVMEVDVHLSSAASSLGSFLAVFLMKAFKEPYTSQNLCQPCGTNDLQARYLLILF